MYGLWVCACQHLSLPSPGARHWRPTHAAHLRHSGSISEFNKPHADLQRPVPLSGTQTSMAVFVNTVVLPKAYTAVF